jgi:hypothetical protein
MGMYAIALALGVDPREIWPATVVGSTKADAIIQHMKAQGKGPGQILQMTEMQINQKYLPPHLKMIFDQQDDEQDLLQAQIREQRSIRHDRDVSNGSITVRVVRQQELVDGDITEAQFEEMELADGRLEDGTDVLALFGSDDEDIKGLLSIGVDNPLNVRDNVSEEALKTQKECLNSQRLAYREKIKQAIAALLKLEKEYEEKFRQEENEVNISSPGNQPVYTSAKKPIAAGGNGDNNQQGGNEYIKVDRPKNTNQRKKVAVPMVTT